jgi:hypothetical protein
VADNDWDEVAGECPAYLHAWQRCAERHLIGYKPRYVLVQEGERLVAIGYRHSISAGAMGLLPPQLPPSLQRVTTGLLSKAAILCNPPLAASIPGIAVHEDCRQPQAVVSRVLDGLTQTPRAFVQLMSGPAGVESLLGRALRSRGYLELPGAASALLSVEWASFDEYLGSMSSKWRRTIRWTCQDARRRGLEIRALRSAESGRYEQDFERLFRSTCLAHGSRYPFTPGVFATLRHELGDRAAFIVALHAGVPVGFVFGVEHRGTLGFPLGGFDYSVSKQLHTVVMLYYAIARHGIESGQRRVLMGLSNLDMKRRLGCQIREQAWFIRTPWRTLDRALHPALRFGHARMLHKQRERRAGGHNRWGTESAPSAFVAR